MKKIAVIFANGTEEIEGITPVDVLRRAECTCDIVSVSGEYPTCSHGITLKADKQSKDFNVDEYDGIIIAGGMPGATNIASDKYISNAIVNLNKQKKLVAAICASPAVVLAPLGVLDGKKATCFPARDFIDNLKKSIYTGEEVQVDGNVITANGPKSAMKFALAICEYLNLVPKI